jgi:N-carbamoylputrescine amidase
MQENIRIALAVVTATVGAVEANLAKTAFWTQRARQAGARLVCFPELNLTGYGIRDTLRSAAQPAAGEIVQQLQALAEAEGMVILAGMAEAGTAGVVFASHLCVVPGQPPGVYRKVHIAPPEDDLLQAGDALPLFDALGMRYGVQLCYDAHFPEASICMALEGADLIFFPHASPRGTPAAKFKSWRRHLPARAFDNGLFVAACNQTGANGEGLEFPGLAAVFGPGGEVLAHREEGREGLLLADLEAAQLAAVRQHRMRYFLPRRRPGVYHPSPRT